MNSKPAIIISNYDDQDNPYYAGGGALAVHEIAKRLTNDYRVTVITSAYPGSKPAIRDGVHYERTGWSFAGPKLGQLFFSLSLPYHVMTRQYHAWLECFTPPFSSNFLQKFTKKPVIAVVHMFAARDMKRKYGLFPFELVEKLGMQTYKKAIVMTDDAKRFFLQKNPSCSVVCIPNGVAIAAPSKEKLQRMILFLGRLEVNQKGIDLLLHAYKSLTTRTDYQLVIAGGGIPEEIEKTRSLIEKLGLQDRVQMVGRVAKEEKERLLSQAAFVVMPSRYESFGIVALEAFAHRKPLVTFAMPQLSWIPTNCSLKAKAFDEVSLAAAMLQLAENENLRKTLGAAALTVAKNYSWDAVANRYGEVISNLL